MAKTTTKTTAKKKAAPKKKLDIARLEKLVAGLAAFPHGVPEDHLAKLEAHHGLKKTEKPKGSGLLVLSMAGVATKPVPSLQQALTNWANKARREIARAEG